MESEHFICHAVADVEGRVLESNGDVDRPVYLRSSAKPLICTAVVASGAADRFGFSEQEIALVAASHNGEPKHVDAARSMLRKVGLDERSLRCGAHAPVDQASADALCLAGQLPTAIHNNCSGKHAGILALVVHRGADPDSYLSKDNPAQAEILNVCAQLLGVAKDSMVIGVDGCGIPAIAVPMRTVAHFFAKLSDLQRFPRDLAPALERVRAAMLDHPDYVAGSDRFDTDLMTAAKPDVLCKGGAEGYHASSALHRGLGMAVKVADGNYRAVAPFVLARMRRLGILTVTQLEQLELWQAPRIKNHAGLEVGEIRSLT